MGFRVSGLLRLLEEICRISAIRDTTRARSVTRSYGMWTGMAIGYRAPWVAIKAAIRVTTVDDINPAFP